jgi:uncharacterized lipoprotein NlpE involved in copper resistance
MNPARKFSALRRHPYTLISMAAQLLAACAIFSATNVHAQAPDLALPATFAGVMPCADCAGIAQTLTLRADGLYRLRSTYLGQPAGPFNELGRWTQDAGRLTLGSGEQARQFARQGAQMLRLLDRQGQPIDTDANLELRRTAQVDPISEVLRWRGELVYFADGATFTDCASGLRWPVVMHLDYLALERSYLAQRSAPGAPLLVRFAGRLALLPAMEGPAREQMLIDAYEGAQPGATCASPPDNGAAQREVKDAHGS